MAKRQQASPAIDSPRRSKRKIPDLDETAQSPGIERKRAKREPPTTQIEPTEKILESSPSTRRPQPKSKAVNGDTASYKVVEAEEKVELTSLNVKESKTQKNTKSWKDPAGNALSDEDDAAGLLTSTKDYKKQQSTGAETKPKGKRRTKEEKAAEAMPVAARTVGSRLFVGAHVSAAGGVHNAVTNCVHIGGNAFALFQKSQRKWENPSIKPEHANEFKSLCGSHNYSPTAHVVPHGSYLVNLAARDPAKAKQAYDSFLEDLQRSESLGIKLYNFHPGNTNGEPRAEAIGRIAQRLNEAHKATHTVVTLLENMAASPSGNTIGGNFEDLANIIELVNDKARVGICLDTCHAFAAGHDLRSPDAFRTTMQKIDTVVGFHYLRAVHVNDSKAPFGSHRDLHQNIGCGFLGLRAFHNLVNDPCFAGLPLILETPIDKKDEFGKAVEDKGVWAREIKLLESLVDMDPEGMEFKQLEKELADKGAEERAKFQEKSAAKVKAKRAMTESDRDED